VVFPTITFAIFFAIVLPAAWALMRHQAAWKGFVAAASYVFYATADWRFAFMLAASPSATTSSPARATPPGPRRRKALVRTAVFLDLLALGSSSIRLLRPARRPPRWTPSGSARRSPSWRSHCDRHLVSSRSTRISYVVDVGRGQLEPPR